MTGTATSLPRSGEIWADGEGTLMCRHHRGGWWVFGVDHPIPDDDPKIVRPLRLIFDNRGTYRDGGRNLYGSRLQ